MKRRTLLAAAACGAVAVFLWWPRAVRKSFEAIPPRPFDGTRWQRLDPMTEGEERLAMGRDLLTTRQLIGKPRTEVVALLGITNYERGRKDELWYPLREEYRGIEPTDGDDLIVVFGPDDRVTDLRHRQWHH